MSTDAQKTGSEKTKKQARKFIPLILAQFAAAKKAEKPVSIREVCRVLHFADPEEFVRWVVARATAPTNAKENPAIRNASIALAAMLKKQYGADNPQWFEAVASDSEAVFDSAMAELGIDNLDTPDALTDLGIELQD